MSLVSNKFLEMSDEPTVVPVVDGEAPAQDPSLPVVNTDGVAVEAPKVEGEVVAEGEAVAEQAEEPVATLE